MEYRDWILMVRNNESTLLQQGPYTISEIENLLKEGKVHNNDLAWSAGLTKWIAVKNIFNKPEVQIIESPAEKTEEDLFESIEFLKREVFSEQPVEEVPVEALPEIIPQTPEKRVIIPKSSTFLFNFEHKMGFSIKKEKKPVVLTFILLFTAIMLTFALFLL